MSKKYIKLSSDFGSDLLGYYDFLDQALASMPNNSYECYYVSNGETEGFTSISSLADIPYKEDLIIWLCSDHLRGVDEFKFYDGDTKPHGLLGLEEICKQHPSRKFILLTPQVNMLGLVAVDNLRIVEIPPFNWMIDKSKNSYKHGYQTKEPMKKSWASFINYPLWHRISLASYLLFAGLDKSGMLSLSAATDALVKRFNSIDDYIAYSMTDFEWHCFNQGYRRIQDGTANRIKIPSYESMPQGGNIENYNTVLLPIYNQVRVELVPGSIFAEPTPYITEKELQAIYGSNFMIFVNAPGTVEVLRQWGFDVFDDIVNHSYDQEPDPVRRICTAISDNIRLLNGAEDVNILWEKNQYRFRQNCLHADRVIDQLVNKSLAEFKTTVQNING